MFFLKDLSLKLTLPPKSFGPHMKQMLRSKLIQDVEGTCTGQFGYIICVMDGMKIDMGRGRIIPGDGSAEFDVKYKAIVWRPFRGEVVDGIVSNVQAWGIFVDVGPLKVFIAHQLLPSDMEYNATANPPSYVSEEQTIEKGSRVRLKIVGVRADVGQMYAIGTIKEDYLGVL